jgi:hypothetical protein
MPRGRGRRKSRSGAIGGLVLAALAVTLAAWPTTETSLAAGPAQVQYGLAIPNSGGDRGPGRGTRTGSAPSDERPVSAVVDTFDNTEVILLLTAILLITALALVYGLRTRFERRRWTLVLTSVLGLTALLLVVLPAGGAQRPAKPPKQFFGMSAQSQVPQDQYNRMKQNGAGSFRQGIAWNAVEPSRGHFDFSPFDPFIERVARAGMEPFVYLATMPDRYGVNCPPPPPAGTGCFAQMPHTASQRARWATFLKATVRRYGPNGSFWSDNPGVPKHPVRNYQIWNEENFKFFTEPRSPRLYGKLLKVSHAAIKSVDRRAKVLTGGMFMHPKARDGIQATTFLNKLYGVRGVKSAFDGVAIHPYAKDASLLRPDINAIRKVMKRHGDAKTGLYISEFGWGSGNDTAFEKGIRGQVRELGQAYSVLRSMRVSAKIIRTYWFAWDDMSGSCNFCDSAGLVRSDFSAKPALARFKSIAK